MAKKKKKKKKKKISKAKATRPRFLCWDANGRYETSSSDGEVLLARKVGRDRLELGSLTLPAKGRLLLLASTPSGKAWAACVRAGASMELHYKSARAKRARRVCSTPSVDCDWEELALSPDGKTLAALESCVSDPVCLKILDLSAKRPTWKPAKPARDPGGLRWEDGRLAHGEHRAFDRAALKAGPRNPYADLNEAPSWLINPKTRKPVARKSLKKRAATQSPKKRTAAQSSKKRAARAAHVWGVARGGSPGPVIAVPVTAQAALELSWHRPVEELGCVVGGKGRLFLGHSHDRLAAFDLASGDLLWDVALGVDAQWGAPRFSLAGDHLWLRDTERDRILRISARDGKLKRLAARGACPTTAVDWGGRLLMPDGSLLEPTSLKPKRKQTPKLQHTRWAFGCGYGMRGEELACVDASTGKIRWTTGAPAEGFRPPRVVSVSDAGLLALSFSDSTGVSHIQYFCEGDLVWEEKHQGWVYEAASWALTTTHLLRPQAPGLVATSLETGKRAWAQKPKLSGYKTWGTLACVATRGLVWRAEHTDRRGLLVSRDLSTGKVAQTLELPGPGYTEAWVDDTLVVRLGDGLACYRTP